MAAIPFRQTSMTDPNTKKAEALEALADRVKDLESQLEKDAYFIGLPRWVRILDGAITWALAFVLWMLSFIFFHWLFPNFIK